MTARTAVRGAEPPAGITFFSPSARQKPLYAEDLAYIHHVGFGDFARKAAPELLRVLRRAGIRDGTLVDLACGSGLWAREAKRAGFNVVGVDQSRAMIRLAMRMAPAARFHCASLYTFDLPPCDAVTILGEGLNYLSPDGAAPPLARLFARAARALRPGGLFIFDAIMREGKTMNYHVWRAGKDWAVLVQVKEDRSHRRLTRRITASHKARGAYRRSEETHSLRLFTRADVEQALRQAGFAVRASRRYGRLHLSPRRMAFVARKRQ
jgi:SAM-dependent methyltransferase